jgi:hypothetical protein
MHRRLAAVLLFSVAAIAVPALPAQADPLQCGDTVTTDIVLIQNLNCTGTALRVEVTANSTIHVDLNGYRLKGDGTGTGVEVLPTSSLFGSLAVTNGTIKGFAVALLGPKISGFRIQNLTVAGLRIVSNGGWLPPQVRQGTIVSDTSVIDSGVGGAYTDSSRLTVSNSKFVRSSIRSSSESFNYIYDSTFKEGGFSAGPASNVIALRNTFSHCATGIYMGDIWPNSATKLEDNKFVRCNIGASLFGMSGPVLVQHNTFSRNAVAGLQFSSRRPLDASIVENTFSHNGGDGLSGTGTSGTEWAPVAVQVTGNLAVRNAGYGINVSSVIDGGQNTAKGNGNATQCSGVICTKP